MARYYSGYCENGLRCSGSLCSNKFSVFGSLPCSSRYAQIDPILRACSPLACNAYRTGYCSECNARWYAWKTNSSLRACSRGCTHFLLCAFGIGTDIAMIIREFVYICFSNVRRACLLRHKFRVTHLLWLSAPVEMWMGGTDTEAEDERYANPILRTLIEVYLEPASEFYRTCFGGALFTNRVRLLDAVSTYLTDPFEMQYTCGESSFPMRPCVRTGR